MYKVFYWDKEAKKEREVIASENYDVVWDTWTQDKENQIIICSSGSDDRSGNHYCYLVAEGRKPGVYKSYKLAESQTDKVGKKPKGCDRSEYVAAWFAAVPSIRRGEERDTEIVRKSCGCCWYCGTTLVRNYSEGLGKGQRDHQTSQVNGGGNEIGNMVLACEKCNTAEKNHLNLEDYRAKVLAANPQAYPGGRVVFFGEQPVQERHALKLAQDPAWVCPGESNPDIPCLECRT